MMIVEWTDGVHGAHHVNVHSSHHTAEVHIMATAKRNITAGNKVGKQFNEVVGKVLLSHGKGDFSEVIPADSPLGADLDLLAFRLPSNGAVFPSGSPIVHIVKLAKGVMPGTGRKTGKKAEFRIAGRLAVYEVGEGKAGNLTEGQIGMLTTTYGVRQSKSMSANLAELVAAANTHLTVNDTTPNSSTSGGGSSRLAAILAGETVTAEAEAEAETAPVETAPAAPQDTAGLVAMFKAAGYSASEVIDALTEKGLL
jgi:hypothetical protein